MSPREPDTPPGRRAGAMAAGIVCLGTAAAYLLDAAGVWNVSMDAGTYTFASGMAAAGVIALTHRAVSGRRTEGKGPAAGGPAGEAEDGATGGGGGE